jgi:hypothetical protein
MLSKKREYSGQFAVIDIDFVLNDSRLDKLTDAQKWFYVCLWCLAVKERSSNLGPNWSALNPKVISKYTHVDLKVIRIGLIRFTQIGLIKLSPTGEITVCDVKAKHPNLKWKMNPDVEQIEFDDKETEPEAETETELISAKPKSPVPDDDSDQLDLTQKAKMIYDFYIEHSGRDPIRYKLTPKRVQKIKARLQEGFTVAQLSAAIQAVLHNPWNMGENPQGRRYIELDDHVFRSYEQTEKRLAEFEEKWGKVVDNVAGVPSDRSKA